MDKILPKDPYGKLQSWVITEDAIPKMLKDFENGTRCVLTIEQFEGLETKQRFTGRVYVQDKLTYIKLTNDERRRIIPILHKLSPRSSAGFGVKLTSTNQNFFSQYSAFMFPSNFRYES